MSSPAPGALDGIRVLELSVILSAPYAGVHLAEMGAQVIKVEPPGGEPFRNLGTPVPGHAKLFQWANRGKRSLVLDLHRPEARDVVRRMLPRIDVVLVNYRPGIARRLGLDYASLVAHKPDLIYADVNGFGTEGPLAASAASDIVAQAYGGTVALDAKVDEHGAPDWPAVPVADLPAGIATAMGICAALFHRERTGEGQLLSVSLLRTAMHMTYMHGMVEPVNDSVLRDFQKAEIARVRSEGGSYRQMLDVRRRMGRRGSAMSVYFSGYAAKDGGLVLGALTPANRNAVRRALGIDDDPSDEPGFDGSDPANIERMEAVRARIREILAHRTVEEWLELFEVEGVPVAPVVFPEDLEDHPQASLHLAELVHEITGPQKIARPLVDMAASPMLARAASPIAGAHTDRVLAEIGGYDGHEIAALRTAGVIE